MERNIMKKMMWTVMLFAGIFLFAGLPDHKVYAEPASREAKDKAAAIAVIIAPPGLSDYEKAVVVHDWLCANCRYNELSYATGTYLPSDHSADGPLLYGTSVCEGYAEAFKLFMDILGVKNRRVGGWAGGGYHGWNEICIDGQWLSVDTTWDDPVFIDGSDPGGVYSRQYCLISPAQMALDHTVCEYY